MARSRKRVPVSGITKAESDKEFKQQEHRRKRSFVRTMIRSVDVEDEDIDIAVNDAKFGNGWSAPKDGKFRFDPEKHPEWMRK